MVSHGDNTVFFWHSYFSIFQANEVDGYEEVFFWLPFGLLRKTNHNILENIHKLLMELMDGNTKYMIQSFFF